MEILNKLLKENNNKWQIVGAVIGSFLGLLLLLLSLQFYMDLKKLTTRGGGENDQFIILNKKLSLNVRGAKATFSPEEVEALKKESFIKKIGLFTPSTYKVGAGIEAFGFYTELFFESVPDEFLDVKNPEFKWEEGQENLPIIISKDFLALYNFGFASSQGLPQLTPEAIDFVNLDVTIRGNGKRAKFKGTIAGFSSRISSILVPQSFMDYTNKNYQDFQPKGSARLMVLADNPYSKEFKAFLKEKNYELSTGKLIGGEVATAIRSLITAVAIIGFLIVILSVFIFVLNFQLIISKSSRDVSLMMQLGYKQNDIGSILKKYLLSLFGIVVGLTIVFFIITRFLMLRWFGNNGLDLDTVHWIVFAALAIFSALFMFINYSNIEKSIKNLSS